MACIPPRASREIERDRAGAVAVELRQIVAQIHPVTIPWVEQFLREEHAAPTVEEEPER
jgi:hypothetical protein